MSRFPAFAFLAALLGATMLAPPVVRAEEATPPAAVARPAPAVTVVDARTGTVVEQVVVTGTLVPREEVQVSVDVEGLKIDSILAEEGDSVEAGALLAKLSTDTIDVQLAQLDSQIARAKAAVIQAESQINEARSAVVESAAALERSEALKAKGVIAQDVLDQRTAAATAAAARLASAEQGLAVANADVALTEAQRREIALRRSKTEIKATTAGLVLERTARLGAVASAQGGPLFRLAEDGMIELEADVPETALPRISTGQPVAVTVAGADAPVEGEIRLVSPEVDRTTRLGRIRVALPRDAVLRAGAFARGVVETARGEGVVLPVGAVMGAGTDTAAVMVVKDGAVSARKVETGLSGAGVIEIRSGLEPGETVVAKAGSFLRDGDKVTPIEATVEEFGG